MSSFLKGNKTTFNQIRLHKPSFSQSQLTAEDSMIDGFSTSAVDYSSCGSVILKENYDSLNSTDNITFANFVDRREEKKENNLAYSVCARFPPKIRKQVESIIDYYEAQLEGQKQLFWKMTIKGKNEKHEAYIQGKMQSQLTETITEKVVDTTEKDKRINELEEKVMQKNQKINQLNKEITTLMTTCTKLNKELSSPSKSIRSSRMSNYEMNDF